MDDPTPQTPPEAEDPTDMPADDAPDVTPEEAIAIYSAALAANPDDALAYFNRGNAHYNAEQLEEAIDDYRQAARLDPALVEAHSQRGYALFGLGNIKAALDAFSTYVKLAPDDPLGHNNQAFLYLVEGRTSRAEGAWRRATALEGAPDYAYAGHALALYRLKKRRAAAEQYAQAVALNPQWRDDIVAAAEQVAWSEKMVEDARAILRLLEEDEAGSAGA